MLITIENLFHQILKIAKQKRETNPSFDGKKFWEPTKQYYPNLVGRQLNGENNQKLNMKK